MKKDTVFLLEQAKKMSGDQKVRIALQWSKLVRDIRKAGNQETKKKLHG